MTDSESLDMLDLFSDQGLLSLTDVPPDSPSPSSHSAFSLDLTSPPGGFLHARSPDTLCEHADDDAILCSISTTFQPGADLLPAPPDVILKSDDGVFFYVHRLQLAAKSMKIPGHLLLPNPAGHASLPDVSVYALPELASVLNIVLHVVYDLSCDCYQPALSTMLAAVDAMATYGLRPSEHLAPTKPLFARILNHAPVDPVAVYALAAHHGLDSLAVQVSSYLLPLHLQSLPTAYAVRMGPLYLKRLFFLHLGRLEALRRVLLPLPHPHAPSPKCGFVEQKKLARAWVLASAFLIWDERPDLPASAIQAAAASLMQNLSCDACKAGLAQHVKQIVAKWSMVKVCRDAHAHAVRSVRAR